MSAQLQYPNKTVDEHGFLYRYTYITQEECRRILKKDFPTTTEEAIFLCQHFSSRVMEVGKGIIFKPYDSK